MKKRLVLITEIIAPYRIPVFNALAARAEIDLHVVFLSETDPSLRQWDVYKQDIRFDYQVLPSFRRRIGRYHLLLNKGVAFTLKQLQPDVIICGGYNYIASWQAAYWAKRHRIPFLLWSESTASDSRRGHAAVEALKRHFLGLCAGFVVAGLASRDYFRQLGVPERLIFIAPDAVDNNFFRSRAESARSREAEIRRQLALPARYFLYVGRLVREKGVYDLLDAYAKLDAELRSEVSLVFVGDGVEKRALEERAASIAPGQVEFRGFLQREDLPFIYALAEALVFPTHSDTWGLVVNEAMACGLPVVASDVAGCVPDLVLDSITGVLVPSHAPARLSEAIHRLMASPEETDRMGVHAAQKIGDYSPQACASGMVDAVLASGGEV